MIKLNESSKVVRAQSYYNNNGFYSLIAITFFLFFYFGRSNYFQVSGNILSTSSITIYYFSYILLSLLVGGSAYSYSKIIVNNDWFKWEEKYKNALLQSLIFIAVLLLLTNLAINFGLLNDAISEKWYIDHKSIDYDYATAGLIFVCTVFFGPALEEMMYRGFLYDAVKHVSSKYLPFSTFITISFTTIIFTLEHGDQYKITGMIIVLIFGFALGYLRSRTGSLLPGILLHSIINIIPYINNAVSVILND